MIFSQVILLAFNFWMAGYHSRLIKKGITPYHGWWGLFYLVVLLGLSWLTSWWLIPLGLLNRKVFFDTALNLYRDLPLFYVSSTTTSIIDRIHYKLFGKKSEIYMFFYFFCIILLNLCLILKK